LAKNRKKKAGEAMKDNYIAVFDSGVGGISVLRELVKLLPQERFLYFGDSANAPYGVKTTQQVRQLTLDVAQKLMQRGIKALVVACNTATSAAIEELRQKYPQLIVVGIEPALKVAAERFPQGTIGVMATQVTLREEKFSQQLQRFPDARVIPIAAGQLVELVEAGLADSPQAEEYLTELLQPYVGKLDALVLGCTHFPFAAKTVSKILGSKTVLLDGGEGTARQTRRLLQNADLLRWGEGFVELENSANDPRLIALSKKLLEETL